MSVSVTNYSNVQQESRGTSGQFSDRAEIAQRIACALRSERFCEPELSIIVKIVCDAMFGGSTPVPASSTEAERRRA